MTHSNDRQDLAAVNPTAAKAITELATDYHPAELFHAVADSDDTYEDHAATAGRADIALAFALDAYMVGDHDTGDRLTRWADAAARTSLARDQESGAEWVTDMRGSPE